MLSHSWKHAEGPRVLAVASSGGHFVQLMRLMPAWCDCDLTVVTTDPRLEGEVLKKASLAGVEQPRFRTIADANKWQKARLVRSAFQTLYLILALRPHVVISTGAAPGFLALRMGRLVGARTVWIDSIANADELSLSGKRAGACSDLWLTQWPHLAKQGGPDFKGAVL